MSAPPAKGLFRATKRKDQTGPALPIDLPKAPRPAVRDPLDFDPTPESATEAFLREEIEHIKAHGNIAHEAALGAGHMSRVMRRHGLTVRGGDVMDRKAGEVFCLGSFFHQTERAAPIHITNPPYNEINSSKGHGRWLRHAMALDYDYIGLLLNADWPAARMNGFDGLLHDYPPSIELLCCWKIDFRGGGSPPQRNSWFVWDKNRPAPGPCTWLRKRLYIDAPDPAQMSVFGEGQDDV